MLGLRPESPETTFSDCPYVPIHTIQIQSGAIRRRYSKAPQYAGQWQVPKKRVNSSLGRGQEAGEAAAQPRAPAAAHDFDTRRDALALEFINHGVYDWDIPNNSIYYSPRLRASLVLRDEQTLTPEEFDQPGASR